MYSWKIFKYPFGRFACWLTILETCVSVIRNIAKFTWYSYLYYRTTLGATSNTKNLFDFETWLSKYPEFISKHLIEHFTWVDAIFSLLIASFMDFIVVISYYYALRRTLFYPYKYIKITVPFDKVSAKHTLFIMLGIVLLSDVLILTLLPKPQLGQIISELLYYPFVIIWTLIVVYGMLNIYMNKVAKIDLLYEKNADSNC